MNSPVTTPVPVDTGTDLLWVRVWVSTGTPVDLPVVETCTSLCLHIFHSFYLLPDCLTIIHLL